MFAIHQRLVSHFIAQIRGDHLLAIAMLVCSDIEILQKKGDALHLLFLFVIKR